MDARSVRNMYSIIAVTNKHTAKLHHVGSLYILTYDARKLKHKIYIFMLCCDRIVYIMITEQHNGMAPINTLIIDIALVQIAYTNLLQIGVLMYRKLVLCFDLHSYTHPQLLTECPRTLN